MLLARTLTRVNVRLGPSPLEPLHAVLPAGIRVVVDSIVPNGPDKWACLGDSAWAPIVYDGDALMELQGIEEVEHA